LQNDPQRKNWVQKQIQEPGGAARNVEFTISVDSQTDRQEENDPVKLMKFAFRMLSACIPHGKRTEMQLIPPESGREDSRFNRLAGPKSTAIKSIISHCHCLFPAMPQFTI
jgi:hypothetical protein